MGFNKHLLTFFVVISSISLRMGNSIHAELPDNYIQDEYGYDFEAYPSYLNPLEDIKLNNSGEFEDEFPNEKNFRRMTVSSKSINVLKFGAKGDGKVDDSKAFHNAWKEACLSSQDINYIIPHNKTYLLKPLRLSGPCKSHIKMQIAGEVKASDDRTDYEEDTRHWILFENVQNLVVDGGGTVDGNGDIWWQNSCKRDKTKPCQIAPTALTFYNCANLVVKNLKIENAQQIHVSIEQCTDVEAANLVVNTPEESPNTDGIHVADTENIHIHNCVISTGDDCISIVSGSNKVRATNITCGPGHGISIGSLGTRNSEEYVADVVVNGAKLSGTTNGVRIKTWQGGSGSASNIKFQNIEMQNVQNPILIDQHYCDQDQPCKEQSSAVQLKNIVYKNIKGSSASNTAIKLECSKKYPCQGIVLQNVNLVTEDGAKSEAVCNNVVNLQNLGNVTPNCP